MRNLYSDLLYLPKRKYPQVKQHTIAGTLYNKKSLKKKLQNDLRIKIVFVQEQYFLEEERVDLTSLLTAKERTQEINTIEPSKSFLKKLFEIKNETTMILKSDCVKTTEEFGQIFSKQLKALNKPQITYTVMAPLNIALMGRPRIGKSAFVKGILTSEKDTWRSCPPSQRTVYTHYDFGCHDYISINDVKLHWNKSVPLNGKPVTLPCPEETNQNPGIALWEHPNLPVLSRTHFLILITDGTKENDIYYKNRLQILKKVLPTKTLGGNLLPWQAARRALCKKNGMQDPLRTTYDQIVAVQKLCKKDNVAPNKRKISIIDLRPKPSFPVAQPQ